MDGASTLSDFLTLIKELKKIIRNGDVSDFEASKIFEIAELIEHLSDKFSGNDDCDELDKQLVEACGMSLTDILKISDKILAGFLLSKTPDNATRKAISEFITRFGDKRFSSVCTALVSKRQMFLTLATVAKSECSDDIAPVFLLQLWSKLLLEGPDEKATVTTLLDSMLCSKTSFDILAKATKFSDHDDWKQINDLINSRLVLKLLPFNSEFWSWFINSKDLFQKTIKTNETALKIVFELLTESANNAKFNKKNSVWEIPQQNLNVLQVSTIIQHLLTLECTYNKTKQMIEIQKSRSNHDFWKSVENNKELSIKVTTELLLN